MPTIFAAPTDALKARPRGVLPVHDRIPLRDFFIAISTCYFVVIVSIGLLEPKTTGCRLEDNAH